MNDQSLNQPTPTNSHTFLHILIGIYLSVSLPCIILVSAAGFKVVKNNIIKGPAILTPSPTPAVTVMPPKTITPTIEHYTNFTIDIPPDWTSTTEIVDNTQTQYLYKDQPTTRTFSDKKLEIFIGSPFVYSTSGALCANQWCEEDGTVTTTIAGKTYTNPVIKASLGEVKHFERYSFQINLQDKYPYITATYFTPSQLQEIKNILSTFQFTNSDFTTTGKDITFQGQVLENNTGCEHDALCYLSIRIDNQDQPITVIYNLGESGEQCFFADKTAVKIQPGQKVKVFGQIESQNEISVCPSADYYIHTVTD